MNQLTIPEAYDRVVAVGVDMQNDFCPGGGLPVNGGNLVVAPFNAVARKIRGQKQKPRGVVVLTADWHPPVTSHFQKDGGVWPVHCVAGTEGARFHPDLEIEAEDIIIRKGYGEGIDGYSGFVGTSDGGATLENIIANGQAGRIAVLVGGLATDYCVKETVIDAANLARRQAENGRQIDVYALTDAMRAVDISEGDGERALEAMSAAGARLITTAALLNNTVIDLR